MIRRRRRRRAVEADADEAAGKRAKAEPTAPPGSPAKRTRTRPPAKTAKAASRQGKDRQGEGHQAEAAKPEAAKPRAASLLKTMTLDTVTLQDAVRLLTLPRVLGEIDGEQVTVQNGRYGPYAKKGSDSRSLESEEQLFTLTLAAAKELFAQPKTRGRARGAGRAAAA